LRNRDTIAASRLLCLYDRVQKLFPSVNLSSTIRPAEELHLLNLKQRSAT
jgi:hypothetical protein